MVLGVALIGFYLSPWALGNEAGPHTVCCIGLLILAWTLPLPPRVSLVQQVSNLNKCPSVFRELGALRAVLTETSESGLRALCVGVERELGRKETSDAMAFSNLPVSSSPQVTTIQLWRNSSNSLKTRYVSLICRQSANDQSH